MSRTRLVLGYLLVATFGFGAWVQAPAHSGAPRRSGPTSAPGEALPQEDGCRVCAAAARAGLVMSPLYRPVVHRCPPVIPAVHAASPRGLVALEDVTHLRVDFGDEAFFAVEEALAPEGVLRMELRVGAAVLERFDVPTDRFTRHVEVPPSLRARLRGVRGCVHWGVFGRDEPLATAALWIEPPSAAERDTRRRVEAVLVREPLWVRHVVRGQARLDAERAHAALEQAEAALALRPGEPHALALRCLCQERLLLRTTPAWHDTLDGVYTALRGVRAPGCRLDEPAREPRRPRPGPCR